MCEKSILEEIKEAQIAIELISFGARIQVLETETSLSRRRLLRLYKELRGCSPPKGMLPFSTDWFMVWENNIHSSMFYNIFLYLQKTMDASSIEIMIKAYRLYLEQCPVSEGEQSVLGLTRAWTLLRFIDCRMITSTTCCSCKGHFIITAENAKDVFICSLCCPPSRANKKYLFPETSSSELAVC